MADKLVLMSFFLRWLGLVVGHESDYQTTTKGLQFHPKVAVWEAVILDLCEQPDESDVWRQRS